VFAIGNIVKFKNNIVEHDEYYDEHKSLNGEVLETSEGWVCVKWQNGQINSYKNEWLEFTHQNESTPETTIYTFRKGDRVYIDLNHSDYGEFYDQHGGDIGTIDDDDVYPDQEWVSIQWDNGHENRYHQKALLLANNTPQPTPIPNPSPITDLPILVGQRVAINPSYEYYQDYKFVIGYVIFFEYSSNYHKWRSHKQNLLQRICQVLVDESIRSKHHYYDKFLYFSLKNLLLIDEPAIDVTQYDLSDGSTFYITKDDNYSLERMNKNIIQNHRYVKNVKIYDENWRQSIIEQITSNY